MTSVSKKETRKKDNKNTLTTEIPQYITLSIHIFVISEVISEKKEKLFSRLRNSACDSIP